MKNHHFPQGFRHGNPMLMRVRHTVAVQRLRIIWPAVLHATTLQSDLTKRVSAGHVWDTSIPEALEILETIGFLSHGATPGHHRFRYEKWSKII